MELEQTKIYPFIKDHPETYSIRSFDTGDLISISTVEEKTVWYLLKGIVEVAATSYNGRKIHVDFVYEDDFVGKISHGWGMHFYCDCIAYTPCVLAYMPRDTFYSMIEEDKDFKIYFYERCVKKVYSMYKDVLATKVFSQQQLFAAEIVTKSENSVFFIDFEDTCNALNATTRNIYNLIKVFEGKGLITYGKLKTVFVKDEDELRKIAPPVLDFRNNSY